MKVLYKLIVMLLCSSIILNSCQKEFLEKKPDKALLVPGTLNDLRALLDNNVVFNLSPGLGQISADDYASTANGLASLPPYERNSYLWAADIYEGQTYIPDWSKPYQQVFYTNVVLEGLEEIIVNDKNYTEWSQLKGSALFYRAFAFYNLAQMFTKPYNKVSSVSDPGIPIRLKADVNVISKRGTLQETYDQILYDLLEAKNLVPVNVSYKSRPGKAAVFALLSRVGLTMENYDMAALYADSCLGISNKLLDYNVISPAGTGRPFPSSLPDGNDEVLFYSAIFLYNFPVATSLAVIDSTLYRSYLANDLRKILFFRDRGNGNFTFRGSYSGPQSANLFNGLATDEVLLTRAECYARKGNTSSAMADLNQLLISRWKKNTFIPLTAANADDALMQILTERRKELIARGIRWTDLRRLNKDSRFAVTMKRLINKQEYTLLPNDSKYVFPIPENEIGTGIEQNPR